MAMQPFNDPWNVLMELGPIMEALEKEFPSEVTEVNGKQVAAHSAEFSAINEWYMKILNCSWKLPHVHTALVKRQKITQGGPCCGLKDMCALLTWIGLLRPATVDKVKSSKWRNDYATEIHHRLCCIINIDEQQQLLGNNTFPHITEIPNFAPNGLPGFAYPNYRLPPLTKIVRPNNYRKPPNLTTGTGTSGDGEAHRGTSFIAYNVDGTSRVFGTFTGVPYRMIDSPLDTLRSFLCADGGQIDFGVDLSCSVKLPNLNVSFQRTLTLPECVSQYVPPMFHSVNLQATLMLGGGEEIGFYNNVKLLQSNFGKGFAVVSSVIAELVSSSPFDRSATVCGKAPVGINQGMPAW